MENSLISVIVPVYRVEPYLDACIASITNQTHSNLEIILVDDGSPDGCPEMCDQWAARDPRIRVIHKENGGLSSARNAGLDIATGEFIGFVDSDDMVRPDMYELLLNALLHSGKKIACCLDGWVPEKPAEAGQPEVREVGVEETLIGIFRGSVGTSVWRRLYRKSIWEKRRFYEGETNEDFPLLIPTTVEAGGMVQVLEKLYYYRPTPDSITSSYWKTDGRILLKNLERMYDQMQQYNLKCSEEFRGFAIKSVYCVGIALEKHYGKLSPEARVSRKIYLKIMKENFLYTMSGNFLKRKDKVLYFMVITHTLRPVYALLGKG